MNEREREIIHQLSFKVEQLYLTKYKILVGGNMMVYCYFVVVKLVLNIDTNEARVTIYYCTYRLEDIVLGKDFGNCNANGNSYCPRGIVPVGNSFIG